MATIFEFDQIYATEAEAARSIPHLGVGGWRVVEDRNGYGYRLTLEVGERPLRLMRLLQKEFPLLTFRIVQTNEYRI